jgi:hypothetical protein
MERSREELDTRLKQQIQFIVEVDKDVTHTIYLKHPFKNAPDFQADISCGCKQKRE